ncbi:MAG: hypothetical protein DSY60_01030 [Persephonella sp.]|nr:MAG: hypothetical protein DSY60_01030 [Persephonella sp.]
MNRKKAILQIILLSMFIFPNIYADEIKQKLDNIEVDIKVRGKHNTTKFSECREFFSKSEQSKISKKVLDTCNNECNTGNGISCLELGKYYVSKKNFKKAEQLFRRSCYLNEPRGCTNLATLYYHGIDGIKQDYKEAIKYYKKACDLDEPTGCHNLGLIYMHGKGVGRDLRKAVKSLKEACNLGLSPACEDLSKVFKRINRRKHYKVNQENLDLLTSKCYSGNRDICVDIGTYFVKRENFRKARIFFSKACHMGSPIGCNNLGLMFYYGYGVKQNFKEAFEYFERACKRGEAVSCNNIGTFYFFGYGVKKDKKNALKYYKRACDMGSALGCKNLAIMYKYGYGTSINENKATRIYRRGCKQSNKGKNYRCEEIIYFK